MTLPTLVVVSGGFDPLHPGHLDLIAAAKGIADAEHDGCVLVGVNSDEWLARKKGKPFMPWSDRCRIMNSLYNVDYVWSFDDSDGTAKALIKEALAILPPHKVIFCNGGDRTADNIPEMDIQDPRLEFRFGVGGDTKAASSSDFLVEWKEPLWVQRPWGRWCVLDEGVGFKVKRLEIYPDQSISLQYHKQRSEVWTVVRGQAVAVINGKAANFTVGGTFTVPVGQLHRVYNNGNGVLACIEVQYGEACIEEDIVRV